MNPHFGNLKIHTIIHSEDTGGTCKVERILLADSTRSVFLIKEPDL
jgi:hypothetical protein